MNRVIMVIVGLLAALFGPISGSGSAAAVAAHYVPVYTYDSPQHPMQAFCTTSERGPPAACSHNTTYDAVGAGSRGALPRLDAATRPAIYDYDDMARFAQGARSSHAAEGPSSGGEAGVCLDQRLRVAAKAATAEIDASKLTMTRTVEQHLTEYAKDGTLARPYGDSRLTIQEIMRSGDPVPDPGGVPGALRWDAPGAFGKSSATWELVVNPETNTILHFLFRSGQ